MEVKPEPILFLKPPGAVIGPHDADRAAGALVPGRLRSRARARGGAALPGRDGPASAADFVAGYTCGNDVTARDLQKLDGQWTRAKSFDTFCPLGPWVVREQPPASAAVTAALDGVEVQRGRVGDMIVPPLELLVVRVGHHDARAGRRDPDRHAAGRGAARAGPDGHRRGRGRRQSCQPRGRRAADVQRSRPAAGRRRGRPRDGLAGRRGRRRAGRLGAIDDGPCRPARAAGWPPLAAATALVTRLLGRGAATCFVRTTASSASPALLCRRCSPASGIAAVALKGPALAARSTGATPLVRDVGRRRRPRGAGDWPRPARRCWRAGFARRRLYPTGTCARWHYHLRFAGRRPALSWSSCIGVLPALPVSRRSPLAARRPRRVDCGCPLLPAPDAAWQLLVAGHPCGAARFRPAGAARRRLHRPRLTPTSGPAPSRALARCAWRRRSTTRPAVSARRLGWHAAGGRSSSGRALRARRRRRATSGGSARAAARGRWHGHAGKPAMPCCRPRARLPGRRAPVADRPAAGRRWLSRARRTRRSASPDTAVVPAFGELTRRAAGGSRGARRRARLTWTAPPAAGRIIPRRWIPISSTSTFTASTRSSTAPAVCGRSSNG